MYTVKISTVGPLTVLEIQLTDGQWRDSNRVPLVILRVRNIKKRNYVIKSTVVLYVNMSSFFRNPAFRCFTSLIRLENIMKFRILSFDSVTWTYFSTCHVDIGTTWIEKQTVNLYIIYASLSAIVVWFGYANIVSHTPV